LPKKNKIEEANNTERERERERERVIYTFLPITRVIFKSDRWVLSLFIFGYLPQLLIKSIVPTYGKKKR
jgi:hypothetical protein